MANYLNKQNKQFRAIYKTRLLKIYFLIER